MALSLAKSWRSQLTVVLPIIKRSFATEQGSTKRITSRIPLPTDRIKTPQDFLKAIGRDTEKKLLIDSWEEFWGLSGLTLKEKNIAVRDRRYILWCMERYRQGFRFRDFVHPAKPPKKIRGWGPAVQNGKRIRG